MAEWCTTRALELGLPIEHVEFVSMHVFFTERVQTPNWSRIGPLQIVVVDTVPAKVWPLLYQKDVLNRFASARDMLFLFTGEHYDQ